MQTLGSDAYTISVTNRKAHEMDNPKPLTWNLAFSISGKHTNVRSYIYELIKTRSNIYRVDII